MEAGPLGLQPAEGLVQKAILDLKPGLRLLSQALQPLVDSADVGPLIWNSLLDRIEAAPGPVLVTHGTDTMAFTGAALDAALAGQGRVVILCGSMRPLGVAGSDAPGNLALALTAAFTAKPGVWLAFAGHLWPAGAITKAHSEAEFAFQAAGDLHPAQPPLVRPAMVRPALARRYDPGLAVGVVTVTPGLTVLALQAALAGLDGAVLRVFGAGTLPAGLDEALAAAMARGCQIVAISQCAAGGLAPGTYAAGAAIWAAGVENGAALSTEQALTRLWLRLSAARPAA